MVDKKEVARLIYEKLKDGNIDATIHVISEELEKEKTNKLKITKTPLLNSIGQELGKLLIKEDWKFEGLMNLWKMGKRDEKLIVISALGVTSKGDYEKAKQFVFEIMGDIHDWEICDQLALRVNVNLAVQNQNEVFSMLDRLIESENKWIRRLAVATIPPFIRARTSESRVCLEFLNKVMREEDKDVKKAIGWSLREITKKDAKAVYEFLKGWAKSGDKNTRWIIKEGMKKLDKEKQDELRVLMGV